MSMGGGPEGAEEQTPKTLGARLKGGVGNLLLLTTSLLIAALLAEVAIRIAAPQQLILVRPDLWASADSLGWRNAANLDTHVNTGERTVRYVTDVEGFRVGVDGRRIAPDSILLIGDSFMAAQQVEYKESLAGLVEDSLKGAHREAVAVRNSAVGAWDPWHYLIFGRSRLLERRYSLALVAVFVGNDVVHRRVDYIEPKELAQAPEFRIPFSIEAKAWIDGVARPLNTFLESRSHLFVFVKNRTDPLRIRLGLSPSYVPEGLLKERAQGGEWRVTADILQDLAVAAEFGGTPTLFVLIPARYQVERELFESHAPAFGIDVSDVDLDQPNRILGKELEARGLAFFDALPGFRAAAADGRDLYGTVDPHLSPEGHAVLFELLREPLNERLGGAEGDY